MKVLGVIFSILACLCMISTIFSDYVTHQTVSLLWSIAWIIPACTCFLIGKLNTLYYEFISYYVKFIKSQNLYNANGVYIKNKYKTENSDMKIKNENLFKSIQNTNNELSEEDDDKGCFILCIFWGIIIFVLLIACALVGKWHL